MWGAALWSALPSRGKAIIHDIFPIIGTISLEEMDPEFLLAIDKLLLE